MELCKVSFIFNLAKNFVTSEHPAGVSISTFLVALHVKF